MTLTQDSLQAPLNIPQPYRIDQTDSAVVVTLLDNDGSDSAAIHIEIDAETKEPVIRIWDGINGVDQDPRLKLPVKLDRS